MTLVEVLALSAERRPDRTLLRFEGRRWTYAEFAAHVRAAAGSLRAWGLRPGERVALYLDNTPGYLITYLAALWCGAAVVPVNARYRDAELRHMLGDAAPRLAVTSAAGHATIAAVRHAAASLEAVVELGGAPDADAERWRSLAAAPPLDEPLAGAGDLALVLYTSGTTGRSKGALLTHANLLASARAVARAWRWTTADELLLALPLFHIHGLGVGFHGTLVAGAGVTLRRRFDADETLADLLGGRITMFFGVPTMYGRLLAAADGRARRPAALRLLVSGSAPLAAATLERVEAVFGLRILERYGMTETVMLTGNPLEGPRKAGSVGTPFDGVALRLADPVTDAPRAPGLAGEVQVRGPNVGAGYWRDPEATRAAFTADGWFKTGDLGELDGDGYLTLVGRTRELIISGGFNVYPREVEEHIAALPGVREVAVVGLPDPDLGERVAAAVVLADGWRPGAAGGDADAIVADAIVAHCRRHLAGFKAPRTVVFVDELPRNAMGKLLRHELRDALARRG